MPIKATERVYVPMSLPDHIRRNDGAMDPPPRCTSERWILTMKSLAGSFLAIFLLASFGWAAAEVNEPPLKVLFIGNSYTYGNDLPSLVAALAEAAGGRKIETDRHLLGGCTLKRHAKETKAIDKIQKKKWDVVVLQEHSLGPILHRESMHEHARILDAESKRQGARTVFYLTWARQHIPHMQDGADPASMPDYARAMYQMSGAAKATDFQTWCRRHTSGLVGGLNGGYFDIAKELHATVAPVGTAWQKAMAADPGLILHQADKSHPNRQGSYLAACVFYATLLDQSPIGLPGELTEESRRLVQIAPDEAKILQEAAWQAVQESRQSLGDRTMTNAEEFGKDAPRVCVEIRQIDTSRVDITVTQERPFPVNTITVLHIGQQTTNLCRYAKDKLNTLVFSMGADDFSKTQDGDAITVECLCEPPEHCDFGKLDKSKVRD